MQSLELNASTVGSIVKRILSGAFARQLSKPISSGLLEGLFESVRSASRQF